MNGFWMMTRPPLRPLCFRDIMSELIAKAELWNHYNSIPKREWSLVVRSMQGMLLSAKTSKSSNSKDCLCRQQLRLGKRTPKRKIGPRWYKRHRRHPPRFLKTWKFQIFSPLPSQIPPKNGTALFDLIEVLRLTNQKRSKNCYPAAREPELAWNRLKSSQNAGLRNAT